MGVKVHDFTFNLACHFGYRHYYLSSKAGVKMNELNNLFKRLFKYKTYQIHQSIIGDSVVKSDNIQAGGNVRITQKSNDSMNVQSVGDINITLDGDKVRTTGDNQNIEIRNGVIYVNGRSVNKEDGRKLVAENVIVHVHGNVRHVSGDVQSLVVSQNVTGKIDIAGDVSCDGSINGNVDTTGNVICRGDINGDIDCFGSVTCSGMVHGSIHSSRTSFKR